MTRLETISKLLLEEIRDRFDQEPLDIDGLDFSENFAEMLDRFIVLHIRTWKLEDSIGDAASNEEIGEIKRKLDYCFKVKRPQLIAAINCYLDTYITEGRSFADQNVKVYKGFTGK